MINFKKEKSGGFTVMEMMVVLVIIVIITTIVGINYGAAQKQLALQRAAFKLAQDLRTAQEMAMSATFVACNEGDFHYAYGVSFSKDNSCSPSPSVPCSERYVLFTDCNGNNTYQSAPGQPGLPDVDFPIQSIDFSSYVKVLSLTGFRNANSGDVIFISPYPTTQRDGEDFVSVSIVLSLKDDPTKTKTIVVNKAGLIYVQ